jgi:hypothetical protein
MPRGKVHESLLQLHERNAREIRNRTQARVNQLMGNSSIVHDDSSDDKNFVATHINQNPVAVAVAKSHTHAVLISVIVILILVILLLAQQVFLMKNKLLQ